MLASAITVMLFAMVSGLTYTWARVVKKSSVQTQLQIRGRVAIEKITRALREEMLGLSLITTNITTLAGVDYTHLFLYEADTVLDGQVDSFKGWGLRPQDANDDGQQDRIDTDRDGIGETVVWHLVEVVSTNMPFNANGAWSSEVVCHSVSAPWLTADGQHAYLPFECTGSDLDLDVGNDGLPATSDLGEGDGFVSHMEIGNFFNGNGDIDHAAELAKVDSIGVGLRLLKLSYFDRFETAIIFQGTIKPRNWTPTDS